MEKERLGKVVWIGRTVVDIELRKAAGCLPWGRIRGSVESEVSVPFEDVGRLIYCLNRWGMDLVRWMKPGSCEYLSFSGCWVPPEGGHRLGGGNPRFLFLLDTLPCISTIPEAC